MFYKFRNENSNFPDKYPNWKFYGRILNFWISLRFNFPWILIFNEMNCIEHELYANLG